jgi:hypothetical protein
MQMHTETNAFSSTTADTGANMQTANFTPITTATRTIVERIQDANLELVNLAICELDIEQQLYVALGKCLDICLYLTDSKNLTAKYEFDSYYEKLKLKNTTKLSLVSKVLNCTFADINVSKRSAYKAVIQFAIDEGVLAGEFVEFVTVKYSGLQQARLAKYNKAVATGSIVGYKARLQQTQSYFTQQQIASVPELVLEGVVPTDQVGEQFVLIAQRTADGNIVFNVATAESKAVNAVLNILHKDNKPQIAEFAKTSLQTSFSPTGTTPVPPDSFAASSYSTDASSNAEVVSNILKQSFAQVTEEVLA